MQQGYRWIFCWLGGVGLALSLVAQQSSQRQIVHYGVADGLSQGSVYSMLKDSRGLLWFTSYEGLNRFDGDRFAVYYSDPADSTSLRGSVPLGLVEDPFGNIWVGTEACLNRYRRQRDDFDQVHTTDIAGRPKRAVHYPFYADSSEVWYANELEGIVAYNYQRATKRVLSAGYRYQWNSLVVNSTLRGADGRVWIREVTGLTALDPANGRIEHYFSDHRDNRLGPRLNLVCHLPAADGSLWLGLRGGLIHLDPATERWQHYPIDTAAVIADIRRTPDGLFYLGTEGDGLYLFRPATGQIEHLTADNSDLHSNTTASLYLDEEGLLWINTDPEGLDLLFPARSGLHRYGERFFAPYDFVSPGIRCFTQTPDGLIWVGTQEDGLFVFDPRQNAIVRHLRPGGPHGLPADHASALSWGRDGTLWVGTHQGAFYSTDGGTSFRPVLTPPGGGINEPSELIWDVLETAEGDRFLATNAGIRYLPPNSFRARPIDTLRDLTTGDIERFGRWLLIPGYHQGFWALDLEHWWANDRRAYRVRHPLDRFNIKHFVPQGDSLLWLATTSGVLKTRPYPGLDSLEILRHYTKRDGLPSDYVYGLLRDAAGQFWLSTNRGIARLDPRTGRVQAYGPEDNIQGNEFNTNAYFRDNAGDLYFGGTQGFNRFRPPLDSNTMLPRPRLVGLLINGRPHDRNVNIGEVDRIELAYAENTFTLQFSAVDFWSKGDNRYRVRLVGYDADWIEPAQGEIRYTRVPWGQYRFQVLAANSDGLWMEEPTTLLLTIARPGYLSTPAIIGYGLLLATLLALALRWRRRRQRTREQLAAERAEAERIRTLEAFKNRFYTNISHDFRTPLSVIQGVAGRLLQADGMSLSEGVGQIKHQSRQLLQLVEQLLDISRLETGHLHPEPVRTDLVILLRTWLDNYRLPAADKAIQLGFRADLEALPADCDVRLLHHIVDNLLSNALKFTPEGGRVNLDLALAPPDRIRIVVADTGPGIDPELAERIFERFYQGATNGPGSGLGLSFARELAVLLGAQLILRSSSPAGSRFELSFTRTQVAPPFTVASAPLHTPKMGPAAPPTAPLGSAAPWILLIEDDLGMRQYLGNWLASRYQVRIAHSAAAGWELLRSHPVDLVLSDVMLEAADAGFELCSRIKNDPQLGHTPVILITALADPPSRYAGLRQGADAYLTKPIDETELRIRLQELLTSREQLAERYTRRALDRLIGELRLIPDDQALLDQLNSRLRNRLADRDLKARDLANLVGKSTTVFNDWLKDRTGFTPAEYLRHLRLELAHELVLHGNETIDTIATQTGFSDGSYLTKKYKERFGRTPGQVRSVR